MIRSPWARWARWARDVYNGPDSGRKSAPVVLAVWFALPMAALVAAGWVVL